MEFLEEAFKAAGAGEGSEDKGPGSSAPGEGDEEEAPSSPDRHGEKVLEGREAGGGGERDSGAGDHDGGVGGGARRARGGPGRDGAGAEAKEPSGGSGSSISGSRSRVDGAAGFGLVGEGGTVELALQALSKVCARGCVCFRSFGGVSWACVLRACYVRGTC